MGFPVDGISLIQNALRKRGNLFPEVRDIHFPPDHLGKRNIKLRLKISELYGHGWLRQVQFFRRLRYTARLRDLEKDLELVKGVIHK